MLTLLLLSLGFTTHAYQFWGNPVPDSSAVVHFGKNIQITVLTERLLRLTYSPSGNFINERTTAVWNRNLPVPNFTFGKKTVTTSTLTLTYTGDDHVFSADNLNIKYKSPNFFGQDTWNPGMSTHGNLFGTFRTLDKLGGMLPLNCSKVPKATDGEPLHCAMGLISQAGWAVVDDSESPLLDSHTNWAKPQKLGTCDTSKTSKKQQCFYSDSRHKQNPSNQFVCENAGCCWDMSSKMCFKRSGYQDWYFFGHGWDYRAALYEWTLISGKAALPRKHMFGLSWSKWQYVNATTIEDQMTTEISAGFPLDTYIFDMNWHVQPYWGGYTWNTTLYPNPTNLIKWFHDKGVPVAANLHDCDGVEPNNALYPVMAAANGVDPSTKKPVLFNISNPTYAMTLEDIMLQPLVDIGMDFWWTDWQQGLIGVQEVAGLNPTFWLNHLRYTRWQRTESHLRGQHLARFGGLGNHRYPVGFGGDVAQEWSSLEMMIYFTQTATNVAFCYWAQEIMQHGKEHELFTRVIQFGAWSPIYTNYGNGGEPDLLANLPEPYMSSAREALRTRNQYLPLRYTLGREAYDSGLGPYRPMYYRFPYDSMSYSSTAHTQYMFGDDIIVAPVYTPNSNGTTTTKVWLPYSKETRYWFEVTTGTMLSGNQTHTATVNISQTPIFIRSGAVIPMLPYHLSYQTGIAGVNSWPALDIVTYPYGWGGQPKSGSINIYEDDGVSVDYESGHYSNTTVRWELDMDCQNWTIVTTGTYEGMGSHRNYRIMMVHSTKPSHITYNGKMMPEVKESGKPDSWSWDLSQRLLAIILPLNTPLKEEQRIRPCF